MSLGANLSSKNLMPNNLKQASFPQDPDLAPFASSPNEEIIPGLNQSPIIPKKDDLISQMSTLTLDTAQPFLNTGLSKLEKKQSIRSQKITYGIKISQEKDDEEVLSPKTNQHQNNMLLGLNTFTQAQGNNSDIELSPGGSKKPNYLIKSIFTHSHSPTPERNKDNSFSKLSPIQQYFNDVSPRKEKEINSSFYDMKNKDNKLKNHSFNQNVDNDEDLKGENIRSRSLNPSEQGREDDISDNNNLNYQNMHKNNILLDNSTGYVMGEEINEINNAFNLIPPNQKPAFITNVIPIQPNTIPSQPPVYQMSNIALVEGNPIYLTRPITENKYIQPPQNNPQFVYANPQDFNIMQPQYNLYMNQQPKQNIFPINQPQPQSQIYPQPQFQQFSYIQPGYNQVYRQQYITMEAPTQGNVIQIQPIPQPIMATPMFPRPQPQVQQPQVQKRKGETLYKAGRRSVNSSNLYKMDNNEIARQSHNLAKDQAGCRFLQKKIEEDTRFALSFIYPVISDHLVDTINDQFGNYLIQKFFEYLSYEELCNFLRMITPSFENIGTNQYGTRVIQKLIDNIKPNQNGQLLELFSSLLSQNIVKFSNDLNGCHIIQKVLLTKNFDNTFVYKIIDEKIELIADHKNGCCFLQKCTEKLKGNELDKILDSIDKKAKLLIIGQYGNYVIQHVMKINGSKRNYHLLSILIENLAYYSNQKFSSNVIEKFFGFEDMKLKIINQLKTPSILKEMLLDSFGNYVVQKALVNANNESQMELLYLIAPLLDDLKNLNFGAKLYHKLITQYPILLAIRNLKINEK